MDTADILVADRTDPGWVALFAACRGLIVAHGNQLSHAAIVAREMQLPTVVSVHDAMSWLEDGDLVEIDGQAGTIRKINDA
jgi:pyruvate,water dikinase